MNCPLTIETLGLRETWLPAERRERRALTEMERLCIASHRNKRMPEARREALYVAQFAVIAQLHATVRAIHERGGLLLIGGAA